jgi:uncharacterized protein
VLYHEEKAAQFMSETHETTRPVLRLDPWMPDYNGAVQIDSEDEPVSGQVDTSVESHEWKAVAPQSSAAPLLYFIDGVRRTDARVLAWDKKGLVHGLFGTVAAGAVRSDGRAAAYFRCGIRRVLVLGGGHSRSATIYAGNAPVEFEGIASIARNPAEVGGQLQELMRQLEAKIAESVLTEKAVVFIDGPLAYITSLGPAVGVIKRISQAYLDGDHFALVTSLTLAQRTPLFLISDGKRDRYSWYLRIGLGRRFEHALAGIIRLEVRSAAGLEAARQLANTSAAVLIEFASSAVRDPRAPQNLVPIGALEQELRRRMGDSLIIRRGIEQRIHEGVEL